MIAKDAVKHALNSTQYIVKWYLSDLSDADLLVRPIPEANHIAWQLGHLVYAERGMMSKEFADIPFPELPAGFAQQHSKATAGMNPPTGFATKEEYLGLLHKVRSATLAGLEQINDADLDRPAIGEMARVAPTLGAMLLLQANHAMMHAGQFTVVRRKLVKPVLF
jgi:hypothetical protein